MHAVDLIIGDYVHRLPLHADEEAVLRELTDAVRSGGALVSLPTARADSTVSVLVSPGVAVFVERTTIAEERTDEPEVIVTRPAEHRTTVAAEILEWADL